MTDRSELEAPRPGDRFPNLGYVRHMTGGEVEDDE
jgi:hypothetical protein